MAKRITICAGIDTGKRKLDVAIDGSSLQLQVKNTAEGHKTLLEWLRRHKVKRIGIEASGGSCATSVRTCSGWAATRASASACC